VCEILGIEETPEGAVVKLRVDIRCLLRLMIKAKERGL
jgi:hypothetical protein